MLCSGAMLCGATADYTAGLDAFCVVPSVMCSPSCALLVMPLRMFCLLGRLCVTCSWQQRRTDICCVAPGSLAKEERSGI
jgi:hypothetical protein